MSYKYKVLCPEPEVRQELSRMSYVYEHRQKDQEWVGVQVTFYRTHILGIREKISSSPRTRSASRDPWQ